MEKRRLFMKKPKLHDIFAQIQPSSQECGQITVLGAGSLGLMGEGALLTELAKLIGTVLWSSLSMVWSHSALSYLSFTSYHRRPAVLLFLKDNPSDSTLHASDPTLHVSDHSLHPNDSTLHPNDSLHPNDPPFITVIPSFTPVNPPFFPMILPFILMTYPLSQ